MFTRSAGVITNSKRLLSFNTRGFCDLPGIVVNRRVTCTGTRSFKDRAGNDWIIFISWRPSMSQHGVQLCPRQPTVCEFLECGFFIRRWGTYAGNPPSNIVWSARPGPINFRFGQEGYSSVGSSERKCLVWLDHSDVCLCVFRIRGS